MSSGKMAAQAGHAFLGSYLASDEDIRNRYNLDSPGTKVCLAAGDLSELLVLRDYARDNGIPYFLVEDSGHILPPHFDGSPIVTALGLGPSPRREVEKLTRHLQLIK